MWSRVRRTVGDPHREPSSFALARDPVCACDGSGEVRRCSAGAAEANGAVPKMVIECCADQLGEVELLLEHITDLHVCVCVRGAWQMCLDL